MLKRLGYFLIGCLVVLIVVYVGHMMLGMIGLPGDIVQFCYVILGILALVAVVYLAWQVFSGGSWPGGPGP